MIKTILLDIDGTLTNSEKKITPLTKATLLDAQDKGVKLCLASGRATFGLLKLAHELKMDEYGGYLISYNGARVTSADGKNEYFANFLNKDRAKALIKHLSKFEELSYVLEEDNYVLIEDCFKNTIEYKGNSFNVLQYETRMNNLLIKEEYDLVKYLDHDTPKVLTYASPEYLRENYEKMKEGFDDLSAVFSADFFFEFTNKGIDKGNVIKDVLYGKLGLKLDEMVAFGDAENDISMLKTVGLGICMANGQQKAKQVADRICGDNDHDGIAYALREIIC